MASERPDDRAGGGGSRAGIRPARRDDAEAVARIFNEGIEERVATFETRPKAAREMAELIAAGALVLVAERDGEVVAFAKVGPYDDPSHYYSGVGEATLYVEGAARRARVGAGLLSALAEAAARRGYWKDVLVVERLLDETAA